MHSIQIVTVSELAWGDVLIVIVTGIRSILSHPDGHTGDWQECKLYIETIETCLLPFLHIALEKEKS